MSIPTRQPFGSFLLQCFTEYRRDHCPDGRISGKLWEEKAEEFHTAWHAANDPKKVKRVVKQTDDQWIEALQADPVFAGIDVRRELGKAQFWCRENNRQCTRKFFTNWLNKADKTVTAAPATLRRPAPSNQPDMTKLREMTDEERQKGAAIFTNLNKL